MKIALINNSFSLSHGGLERFSVNLATVLQRRGNEVHAYAQRAEDLPEDVAVHLVPVMRKPAVRRMLGFQSGMRQALKDQAFDVVYGLSRFFPADMYRMGDGVQRHWMRIRHPFAPLRWLNYLVNPVHLINLYLERRIFQPHNCRRIVTNSRLCKEHAKKYYGVAEERVQVIYNGVDHGVFNPETVGAHRQKVRRELGLSDRDVAIVYVSNNWKRKGLAVILEALSLLGSRGENLHLLVVGRGKAAPFERMAVKLGVEKRLHVIGPTENVNRYYGAGDLLVLPTLYDPFSNVCLEAMACGLPVVTTAENGASELVRDDDNGYVQKDATDSGELSRLLALCLDREHLRDMGGRARQTSLPFTRERNMEETLDLCRKVLEEKCR